MGGGPKSFYNKALNKKQKPLFSGIPFENNNLQALSTLKHTSNAGKNIRRTPVKTYVERR